MAAAHEAVPPAVEQGGFSTDHLVHAEHQPAPHADSECAMQMEGACLQLCAFGALPANITLPTLLRMRGYTAAGFPAADTPYLAPPFQPPKA